MMISRACLTKKGGMRCLKTRQRVTTKMNGRVKIFATHLSSKTTNIFYIHKAKKSKKKVLVHWVGFNPLYRASLLPFALNLIYGTYNVYSGEG